MRRVITTGRTVDEAVTSALVRLGVTRAEADVRVLTEPVKGLFGFFGGKDAEVEVTVKLTVEEAAKDFLRELLRKMGVDASVIMHGGELTSRPITLEITCKEEDMPIVIGRHGVTLDSIQYLVNIAANREQETHKKFEIDAGGYRRRRYEGLCRMADRAAERAVKTGRPVVLDPMVSVDRKVVHQHLQRRTDVTTTSEGLDPNRKVKIVPVRSQAAKAYVMDSK